MKLPFLVRYTLTIAAVLFAASVIFLSDADRTFRTWSVGTHAVRR